MRRFILLFLTSFLIGCSGGTAENSNSAANGKPANANVAAGNSSNPLETVKKPEAAKNNEGQTLAPVLQGFYAALSKKDEAGAKKFLSQAAIKYWETEAKAEKKTWFAYLLESEEPLNEKREIRNEKVEGDSAIAEIRGGSLGVWTPVKFVKENGEWKFASPEDSLALQGVPKTSANTAK